jgi:hypothetical protein
MATDEGDRRESNETAVPRRWTERSTELINVEIPTPIHPDLDPAGALPPLTAPPAKDAGASEGEESPEASR